MWTIGDQGSHTGGVWDGLEAQCRVGVRWTHACPENMHQAGYRVVAPVSSWCSSMLCTGTLSGSSRPARAGLPSAVSTSRTHFAGPARQGRTAAQAAARLRSLDLGVHTLHSTLHTPLRWSRRKHYPSPEKHALGVIEDRVRTRVRVKVWVQGQRQDKGSALAWSAGLQPAGAPSCVSMTLLCSAPCGDHSRRAAAEPTPPLVQTRPSQAAMACTGPECARCSVSPPLLFVT